MSSVVCGNSTAWQANSFGQDACQQYASLGRTCDLTFTVSPATPRSPPYIPTSQNAACTCNVVAYNLMAGCAWCQEVLGPQWWVTEGQWMQNCTLNLATPYNSTDLPNPTNTTIAGFTGFVGLRIPQWARATVDSPYDTWDPYRAERIAEGIPESSSFHFTMSNPFAYLTDDAAFSSAYSAVWGTGDYRNDGRTRGKNTGVAWGVYVGAVVGVIGFLALCLLLVCFLRQKRRKAWYSSVAQYYRQQKAVGGSGVVMNHGPVGGFGEEPPMVVDEDPQHQTLHAAYQPSYNSYAPSESTATSYHPLTSNGNSPYSAPFRIPDGPPGPYQPQR